MVPNFVFKKRNIYINVGGEVVVVHDYSQDIYSPEPHSNPPQRDPIDDDKAFLVGVWTIGVIIGVIIFGFVIWAVGSSRKSVVENTSTPQVAGEQTNKMPKSSTPSTSNQSQNQTSSNNNTNSLTNNEIAKKASEIPGSQIYEVKSGDTLYGISLKFGIDWHEIATVNKLNEPYSLHSGQQLIIPPKGG